MAESWPKELNHAPLCAWRFGGKCDCPLGEYEATQAGAQLSEDDEILDARDAYPGGMNDGEPSDDDIYNGPGVEGGIVHRDEPTE